MSTAPPPPPPPQEQRSAQSTINRTISTTGPMLLPSPLGTVIVKRRPRSDASPHSDAKQSSQRAESTAMAPTNSASLASISTHALGSVDREWSVLCWLHARGVRCVPSFAFLSSDSANDTLETEWMDSSEWKPLSAALHNLTSNAVMQSMLDALRELHAAGVSHGDLKGDHALIRTRAADEPTATSSSAAANSEIVECCFVDFDLSAPWSAPPSLCNFVGNPVYASVQQHLGRGPSPLADAESLLWIFAESCMRQKVQADWLLPWSIKRHRDADVATMAKVTGLQAESEAAMFARLINVLQGVSGDFPSLHRIAACKMAVILGQTQPAAAYARADAIFAQCMASIRPQMLQLLHSPTEHVDPPLIQFATTLQSILTTNESSSSASTAASVVAAPVDPLVWSSDLQTRLERNLDVRLTAVRDDPAVSSASILQRVRIPAPAAGTSHASSAAVVILLPNGAVLTAHDLPPSLDPAAVAHVLFVHRPQTCAQTELWNEREEPDDALSHEPNARWLTALRGIESHFAAQGAAGARSVMQSHLFWRPPPDASALYLRRFFSALLSSGRLFSLPSLHLAILSGRFGLVLSEAQMNDPLPPAATAAAASTAMTMDPDHAVAMMLGSLRRKPEESPSVANGASAQTEHSNKKARTQQ